VLAVGLPDSFLPNATLFLIFLPGLFVLIVWSLVQLVLGAIAVWRRAWRIATIRFLAIAVVVLTFYPASDAVRWISRYAHLATFVAWNTVSPISPDKHEASIEVFDWGAQGISAGASEERFLLRDPSQTSQQVLGRRPWPKYPDAAIETEHLVGAYYLRILYYP